MAWAFFHFSEGETKKKPISGDRDEAAGPARGHCSNVDLGRAGAANPVARPLPSSIAFRGGVWLGCAAAHVGRCGPLKRTHTPSQKPPSLGVIPGLELVRAQGEQRESGRRHITARGGPSRLPAAKRKHSPPRGPDCLPASPPPPTALALQLQAGAGISEEEGARAKEHAAACCCCWPRRQTAPHAWLARAQHLPLLPAYWKGRRKRRVVRPWCQSHPELRPFSPGHASRCTWSWGGGARLQGGEPVGPGVRPAFPSLEPASAQSSPSTTRAWIAAAWPSTAGSLLAQGSQAKSAGLAGWATEQLCAPVYLGAAPARRARGNTLFKTVPQAWRSRDAPTCRRGHANSGARERLGSVGSSACGQSDLEPSGAKAPPRKHAEDPAPGNALPSGLPRAASDMKAPRGRSRRWLCNRTPRCSRLQRAGANCQEVAQPLPPKPAKRPVAPERQPSSLAQS